MFQAQEFVEVTLMPEEYRLPGTIRHADGQHLLIAVEPQDAGYIQPGASAQLVQTVDGGLYQCEAVIVNRRDNMVVTRMGNPQLLQRRRTKRFDCDLPALYRVNLTMPELQTAPGDKMEAARIRDLSLGGAKLCVAPLICARSPLGIRVQLNAKDAINMEAVVVRCLPAETPVRAETGDLGYVVAARFVCVPRIDQVQLHRFLMQLG